MRKKKYLTIVYHEKTELKLGRITLILLTIYDNGIIYFL